MASTYDRLFGGQAPTPTAPAPAVTTQQPQAAPVATVAPRVNIADFVKQQNQRLTQLPSNVQFTPRSAARVQPVQQPRVTPADVIKEIPGSTAKVAETLLKFGDGIVKGISRPFLKAAKTTTSAIRGTAALMAGGVAYAIGDKDKAKRIIVNTVNEANKPWKITDENGEISIFGKKTRVPNIGEVNNIQNMTEAVGVGIEIGADLIGAGIAKQALKQGAQQTAKQFIVQSLKRGALEGGATGGLFGLGGGLQQEKPTVGSVATQTAVGAGTGAIFGALFRGYQANKLLKQNAIDDSLKLIPNKSARKAIKNGLEFSPGKESNLTPEFVRSTITDVKQQIPVYVKDPKLQATIAKAIDSVDNGQYHTLGDLSKAIYKALPPETPVEARQLIIAQSYQKASFLTDPAFQQSDDALRGTFTNVKVSPENKTVELYRSSQHGAGNALGEGKYGSTDQSVAQEFANQQGGTVQMARVQPGKVLTINNDQEYQKAVTEGFRIAKAQGKLIDPGDAGEAVKLYAQKNGYQAVDASKVQPEMGMVVYDKIDDSTRSIAAANATGKSVGRTIKVGKFDVTPDEQLNIQRTIKDLGLGDYRIQTFDDVKRAAADLGTTPENLLKSMNKKLIDAPQVKALGDQVRQQSKLLTEINKKLTNPSLTGGERMALQQEANQAQFKIEDALQKRIVGGTELGRAVAAFRMQAEDINDPLFWYETAKRQLGNKPFTAEIRGMIDDFLNKGDKLGLARAVASLHQTGPMQKAITLWKAGLLSNPGTDVANLSGNVSIRSVETVKDVPATAIDKIVSLFTGKRTKALSPIIWEEQIKGMFVSGPKRAGNYLRYGIDAEDLLSKYDFNRNVNFDSKVLQGYTAAVFRRLGAEDLLFREPALRGSIAEQAVVMARNKGLKGKGFTEFVKNMIKNPTDDMVNVARNDAAYATFQSPSKLASFLSKGAEKGGITGTVIEGVAPFRRTPINIAKVMLDYSPFGIPKTVINTVRAKVGGQAFDQKYFVEGLGRAITGTGIFAAGYVGAKKGLVSGNYPSDSTERKLWQTEGKTPNSIKVGNAWYRIDRIAPIAPLFVLGADMFQINNPENPEDKKNFLQTTGALASSGLSSFREQTFLKGVAGVGKALDKPDTEGPKYVDSLISSFVPSLLGAIARGIDPNRRAVDGTKEAIIARIPGARQTLEPLVNVFGDIREDNRGLLGSLFSPVYTSKIDSQEAAQIVQDAKYVPSLPNTTLKRGDLSVELQGPQATEYLVDMGHATRDAIIAASKDPKYASLDQDQKQDALQKAVTNARADVRDSWKDKQIDKASIKLSDEYYNEDDAPKNFEQLFTTYVKGFLKDPGNTWKAFWTKERIRKVTNDATIFQRRKFLGELDLGDPNSAVDHTIPLSLGGDNSLDNLQILPNDVKAMKDRVEYYLYTLLNTKEINKKQAQERIKNWRAELPNVGLSAADVPTGNTTSQKQAEAPAVPSTPQTSTFNRLFGQ